jgi:hypothetical protein
MKKERVLSRHAPGRASAQDKRGKAADGRKKRGRPDRVWTEELGEKFLALVRETGNAGAAARALGHPYLFDNRMRRHPDFRNACRAACAAADARLSRAESPLLASAGPCPPRGGPGLGSPTEYKGEPPDDSASLGGMMRPGPKREPAQPEPVLRRNCQGRMQVQLSREGQWNSAVEADFLALLRATGNFGACARAVGFLPTSVHQRERAWPAFARECEQALAEADVALTYRLAAHAHALMRRPGEAEAAGIEEEEVPFDPVMAMKILSHIDARKYGRSGKGRRKGPPERTFEQACNSILAKIEAIERHEQMMKARESAGGGGGSDANPPGDPGIRRDDDGQDD